jgi:serine/threonine-protein kinase
VDTADALQVVQPVKQSRLGKYYLLALIGHGGMGEIFLAKRAGPAGFEKLLVIKRILPNLARNPEFVEMFLDEARVAARLNHPNVVQVYEVAKDGPHYYMAMEYVDGQSLSKLVRESIRGNRFPQPEFFARILSYTLEGLHHAHTLSDHSGNHLGIVHRDVSPQNIMITYDGGVKLLDFGIAKARTRIVQTQTGAIKGKYSYMSPEQCWGRPLDARSDVFAAGIILFEVCTGRRLFKTDSDLATMKKITEEPIPEPRAINPHLPPPLEAVIRKALEKDPDRRYESAEAMRNDLEEFLAGRTTRLGSFEIGRFMRELFSEQIAQHKKQIQEVLAGTASLDQPLNNDFDESSSVKFEAGRHSMPGAERRSAGPSSKVIAEDSVDNPEMVIDSAPPSTLTAAAGEKTTQTEIRERRSAIFVGVGVALALLLVGAWFWRSYQASQIAETPPPTAVRPAVGLVPGGEGPAATQAAAAPSAPSAAVAPQPPAPDGNARWDIFTSPAGAAVWLDGKDTGLKTPAILTGIKPGEHQLRLVLAGYVEQGDSWTARANGDRTLRVTLLPLPKADPSPPAAPAAVPGADPKGKPAAAAKEPKTRRDRPQARRPASKPAAAPVAIPVTPPPPVEAGGTLSLDTRPWTDVFLNGKRLGRTPLIEVKVPSGALNLRLVNEGKGIKEVYRVNVKPNQHVIKRLGL